ncbi:malonyl-CoA synthase [Nesterenkonia sp. AN1]|uniref:Acyl-CoA synthetase (AMP-forming)/AMP-acid ligase II n=1 Tax=Nesterenkonia aurantiaca TaxID=1436010 RepID=A0A4V3ECK8_9MICC|nr:MULTISPECIES: AMP-binding protein [Nesterenkonia]EXF24615.1 malonyl-CoA synthase [Nesterenkonia sp. AN1]TDS86832.1 acyl-CoA synthetase (AMP-forming)/AMP-acid ligase II [Nesterenkonia aurantiaca]
MATTQGWLLADLLRGLGGHKSESGVGTAAQAPLDQLTAACAVLMGDLGEASMRAVAERALATYRELDDDARTEFFTHLLQAYSVEPEALRRAYATWDSSEAQADLADLFEASEPRRQALLRRLNHAPDGTLHLVNMRADLRRILRGRADLAPLDRDFRHLLSSWFNRGFLRMEQLGWDAPREMKNHLLRYEKVHPMRDLNDLKRRLRPKDRTCYAFFHPATGDLPLIFVEVALVRGIPGAVEPLLSPTEALAPAKADTAVLYSINNSLDGLAGISFGSLLIKQVIDQVSTELPHLEHFVTLSPIPGFRGWLREQARTASSPELTALHVDLSELHGPADLAGSEDTGQPGAQLLQGRLRAALARYIALERRSDGQPLDPVARFHLGNGATAWQLHWPASSADYMWDQSYGAMITYRYDPSLVERRHENYVRHGTIAVGDQVTGLLPDRTEDILSTEDMHSTADIRSEKGTSPVDNHVDGIYQGFIQQAQTHPEKPLFHLSDGRTLTYAQVLHTSRRIAAKLIGDGVLPGDRVAAQVEKSPEAIALYLATLQVGGVYLPLNTAYTGAEMDYFMADAAPRVLVCDPSKAAEHVARGKDGIVVETLGTAGEGTLLAAEQEHTEIAVLRASDPGAILYTSGTTGRSKGAVLTQGNLAANCASLIQSWEYTSEDVLIHALPIFHIHGLFVAVNMTLVSGASMIWLPKFDPDAVLDAMPEATVLMGVPTFYTRLLSTERLSAEACTGIRLFVSGSAPLLASDHEAFEARTGHAILERYGMTETGMNTSNPYRGGPRRPGTVGHPLPGVEVRIVDRETQATLPQNEVGIIEVRGGNVFAGYWNMPEKTAEEFREDGFFVTGDLGVIDEQGYLSIVGRDKDLVISGGFNIYPKEVEGLIDDHPGVTESAVIGVPHPDLGEGLVAVVVPAGEGVPDETSILQALAGDLARFKQPRAVRFVDALPRNVMGKVQKAELRKQYTELFSS